MQAAKYSVSAVKFWYSFQTAEPICMSCIDTYASMLLFTTLNATIPSGAAAYCNPLAPDIIQIEFDVYIMYAQVLLLLRWRWTS